MANKNLNRAKKNKNDEFYTRLLDIENEMKYYKSHFKDKVVYCNCDDPRASQFFHYFSHNFERLELRKLMATCYSKSEDGAIFLEYSGDTNGNRIPDEEEIDIIPLTGDGDFRSLECIEILKVADIVVTNPPFSLFDEYISQLVEYEKDFLILGDIMKAANVGVFPLIKAGKVWFGRTCPKVFIQPDGSEKKFGNINWYTNLDFNKRHEDIKLTDSYDIGDYETYDNYDAIVIPDVKSIPGGYCGVMGISVSFLLQWSPEQFEILGSDRGVKQDPHGVYGRGSYVNGKEKCKNIFIRNKRVGANNG